MRGFVKFAAVFTLLTGCRAKPVPAPTVADLRFPVAVDYDHGGLELFANATELGTMSIGKMHAATGEPPLIDSSFAIYTLKGLRTTHGTLWLMTHPTGTTPVIFTLERAPRTGLEAVRELMRKRLDEHTWRDDLDEKRRALATEQTLAGMVAIVRGDAK